MRKSPRHRKHFPFFCLRPPLFARHLPFFSQQTKNTELPIKTRINRYARKATKIREKSIFEPSRHFTPLVKKTNKKTQIASLQKQLEAISIPKRNSKEIGMESRSLPEQSEEKKEDGSPPRKGVSHRLCTDFPQV